jgi:hypothetical protein
MWSAITGLGSADGGCAIAFPYPARADCDGSPAGAPGVGYPCFRPGSLRVIVLATDEPPTATYNCPALATVINVALASGTKIIGLYGSGSSGETIGELQTLAAQTGAVDQSAQPIVIDGSNVQAAAALQQALEELAAALP